jgi:hypothetical protein
VPDDWNSSDNTIEVIGGGGGGDTPSVSTNQEGEGGGGGAYSKATNVSLTPGASVTYAVGTGGATSSIPAAAAMASPTPQCRSVPKAGQAQAVLPREQAAQTQAVSGPRNTQAAMAETTPVPGRAEALAAVVQTDRMATVPLGVEQQVVRLHVGVAPVVVAPTLALRVV